MVVERFRKEDKELQIAVQKQAYNVDLCPLMERNLTLLRSGECLDLTIRCGSHEYRLHRAMVCPQSANGHLCRNGKFKEGITGKIDLPDTDPATFARHYSRHGGLDSINWRRSILAVNRKDVALQNDCNALVYAMADKYDIPELGVLAEVRFREQVVQLEMIDLKIEKEDHARTKKWLRDTEELLIKNKLYDRNRSVIFKAMEV
ncbi:hypothetical protein ABVK25_007520 [Lepraria finkii]|uniref:BTB domain-containing protein n=1 Tax=Lepraria finkii TaxID=1340010 RepID=A0ABR4B2F3_9LECA